MKLINNELVETTAEDLEQIEIDKANFILKETARKEADADKETKKASGKQKLLDLGLSEEEIKSLLGV